MFVCVCVSISNSMAEKFFHAELHYHSHEGLCLIKLSESYSCPPLNEAHLLEKTVPSPVPVCRPHTDAPPRGPSLMRNSSVEISSMPFGSDMHPKVWAFSISLFRKRTQAFIYSEKMFVNPNSHSYIHLKPRNHLKLQTK